MARSYVMVQFRRTMKSFPFQVLGLIASLSLSGCVGYVDREYFAPTGLDRTDSTNPGVPPAKPDTAYKDLPGLKVFLVQGVIMDGKVFVNIIADAKKGERSSFRGDQATLLVSGEKIVVKPRWELIHYPPFSAPIDNFFRCIIYLPERFNDVDRFSLILPPHESSPEPLRVDFTRERERQLQVVQLQ